MSRLSHTRFPRAKAKRPSSSHHRLDVETLESRRLLSVGNFWAVRYPQLLDYFRSAYSTRPTAPPYRSLDSLLNRDVELIVKCPGLRDEFCLPETVTSRSVDAAMDSDTGLDDDWFSIDLRKRSLLDAGGLQKRVQSRF